jgi:hypothetical protein
VKALLVHTYSASLLWVHTEFCLSYANYALVYVVRCCAHVLGTLILRLTHLFCLCYALVYVVLSYALVYVVLCYADALVV